jgi:hypothetical protein
MPISTIGSNSLNQTSDLTINGQTVGKGNGSQSQNTAHGVSALAVTTGNSNTAIGYQTALNNTTGFSLVAIGNRALVNNTTGSDNCAVGDSSQLGTTTGTRNVSVGSGTLYANTTGSYNVAMGAPDSGGTTAMRFNTTGSNNVGIGSGALASNTTGVQNTAVGYQAGYSNVSSNYNCYVGDGAGTSTTGARNTFIGQGAGNAVTSGANNTIIGGYNGNNGGLDIRTLSNQIVLADGNGNPRLCGDSGGSWMFGTTRAFPRALVDIPTSGGNAGAPLAISRGGDGGSMVIFYSMSSTTTVIGSIGNSSNTNTTYNTSSDYRLKENIAPMTGALNAVSALKPITWKWKSNGEDGQGFLAHELAEVVPDCVTGAKDAVDADGNPVYQGVDTSYLVATLTAAIQELKTIVDAQAVEIAALKTRLTP